ncbi:hypothetical protein [Streptomyces sp. NPDC002067]
MLAVLGLCAPSATAVETAGAPTVRAAALKKPWDPWSVACASSLLPIPGAQVGAIGCAKKVADKAVPEVGKKVVEGAANALKPMADDVKKFTADMVKTGISWWLMTPSVSIKETGVIGDPDKKGSASALSLHAVLMGIGIMIAVLLTMLQGFRMILQRSGKPFVQIVKGLLVNVMVNAVGVAVFDSLIVASDKLTKTIMAIGFADNDAPERIVGMLLPASVTAPGAVMLMALVVFLIGGAQVVLLFLRQAAIPFQALLLPIAGSGQIGGENTQQWLPRLITAMLTIICYKPMAAVIMCVGFIEIQHGNGIVDWLRGCVTLVLSVFALKSLMSLFAPLGMAVGGGSGAAGGLAGGLMGMVSAAGASEMTSGSGGGGGSGGSGGAGGSGGSGGSSGGAGGGDHSSAQNQAAYMDRNGPSSTDAEAGAAESGTASEAAAVPAQGAEASAAAGSSSTAAGSASGSAAASSGGATAAAGGPVTIALVAAEAAKKAKDQAGSEMGSGGN